MSGRHVIGEALIGEARRGRNDVIAQRRRRWLRLRAADSIELVATSRSVNAKTSSRTVTLGIGGPCTDVRETARGC